MNMNHPSTIRVPVKSGINPFDLNRRVLKSDLTAAAKNVLLVILDHARYGQSVCTASTRTLAREAGITEQYVRRVLSDLVARRLIVIERATGSVHSRHMIRLGQCIHQVETKFPLRLHEVETLSREVETPSRVPTLSPGSKNQEKNCVSFDSGRGGGEEEIPDGPVTDAMAYIKAIARRTAANRR
jgi:hypothetical protein